MTLTISRAFTHLLVIWCCIWVREATSTCYFPDYLQGEYLMQSGLAAQSQVQYTSVSITPDAVSTLGFCQKKIANDLYLIDNLSNSSYCIRCFHLSVKSPNILVVRSAGNPDRCFISVPAAENSCPRAEYLEHARQVILYKSSKEIKKVHCPINGRYMIQYRQNKADNPVECVSRKSELSNCPMGSELKIRFQDCPFENHDITFECLGSWNGPNNQQYLTLFDTRPGEEHRPQYRCGLYLEDSASGIVYMAFSSDSTCLTDLKNSQSGFETMVLTPYPNPQPHIVKCRFPDWIEGEWDSATISEYVFTYTDQDLFKTYSFQCMNYDESDRRYEFPISGNDEKKMLVYGKTRCGEELFTCIWAKRRGINVFEFQLGKNSSPNYTASLCSSSNFQPSGWITQARQNYLANSPCPIEGEYVGTLPSVEGLCAKLASECSSLDTMYYTVSDCSQQIYEEKRRRYRSANLPDAVVHPDSSVSTNSTSTSTPKTVNSSTTPATESSSDSFSSSSGSPAADSATREPSSTASSVIANDSLAVESNVVVDNSKVTTTEGTNVRSYFVENRNLSDFMYEDARFDVVVKTFLPPPVSSSTLPPSYRSANATTTPPPQRPYYHPYDNRFYRPPNQTVPSMQYPPYPPPPYYQGAEYRQSEEHLRSSYYQQQHWNRSSNPAPPEVPGAGGGNVIAGSGQIYFVDPNAFDRRSTIIALPPIQLPSPAIAHRNTWGGTLSRRTLSYRTFKDREYRCLAQWQENGLTYTFTERKYVGTYECFVGSPISETEFSIREAGRHCARDNETLSSMLGMVLTKKSSCPTSRNVSATIYSVPWLPSSSTPPPAPSTTTTPQTIPPGTVTTTKYTPKRVTPPLLLPAHATVRPWRPVTNIPNRPQSPYRSKGNSQSGGNQSDSGINNVPLSFSSVLVLFSIYHFLIQYCL